MSTTAVGITRDLWGIRAKRDGSTFIESTSLGVLNFSDANALVVAAVRQRRPGCSGRHHRHRGPDRPRLT